MASNRLGISIRSYATAVSFKPSKRTPVVTPIISTPHEAGLKKRVRRDPKRPYPARKAHIYASYTRLITEPVVLPPTQLEFDSPSSLAEAEPSTVTQKEAPPAVLLISHENFSVAAFTKLRSELAVTVGKLQTMRDKTAIAKGDPVGERLSARFQILRPRLFLPAVRKTAGKTQARKLEKIVKGPMAAVILSPVDPPLLAAVMKVVDKAAPPATKSTKDAKKSVEDDFEKKAKPVPVPRMQVAGAYVEWKVLSKEGVRELAKLPRLEELRAQIVGLLGAPAMKLAGVLGAASGGRLALTLEGYKKGLEDAEKKD